MRCKQCGTNLVRGFSFCLECGLPVPPEMLEESGLPQRNTDGGAQDDSQTPSQPTEDAELETISEIQPQLQGGEQNAGADLKPQLQGGEGEISGQALKPQFIGSGDEDSGEALKPKLVGGEYDAGSGEKVRAVLRETSSSSDDSSEKLVFCPNCGTRMQHDPNKCEKCGMALGNRPNAPESASSGIPLFNTDSDSFGPGGFVDFNNDIGGAGGISESDAERIDNFVNGAAGVDPMFNSESLDFKVQPTPSDFAQLTEQLANFSAGAAMPSIEDTESTQIRQKEPGKGEEREVVDFLMNDDLSAETVPMFDNGMPVLGDYSMEENPNLDIDLDPYAFLNTSMDDNDTSMDDNDMSGVGSEGKAPVAEVFEKPVEKVPETPVFKASENPVETAPETPEFKISDRPADKVSEKADAEKEKAFGGFDEEKVVPPTNPFAEDDDFVPEEAPFIAETAPIIEEFQPQAPVRSQNAASVNRSQIGNVKKDGGERELPEPLTAVKPSGGNVPRRPINAHGTSNYGTRSVAAAAQTNNLVPPRPITPQGLRPNVQQAFPTVKCPLCSRQMSPNDKFCSSCGRAVNGEVNPHLSEVPRHEPIASKLNYLPIFIAVIVVIAVVIMIVTAANAHAVEIVQNESPESVESFGEAVCTQISDFDLL